MTDSFINGAGIKRFGDERWVNLSVIASLVNVYRERERESRFGESASTSLHSSPMYTTAEKERKTEFPLSAVELRLGSHSVFESVGQRRTKLRKEAKKKEKDTNFFPSIINIHSFGGRFLPCS